MKILRKDLRLNNDNISEHIFRSKTYLGFCVREYIKKGQVEQITSEIELHDIMLALTLLSRIPNDKKIELIFDLTDVDEDGCLSPDEVYKMIEVIERIFSKENTEMNISSRVLLEKLSRDKALRRYEWVMRSIGMLKSRSKNDEGLITLDEFQNVLDKVPNLKTQFLPRFTDLKSVLKNENSEPQIFVDERNLEDFLIFRYELQALFSDNLKSSRKKKLPPIKKPGKSNENKIWKKECPGLINSGETSKKLTIPKEYWELNSAMNTILVREKTSEKGEMICKHYDREEAIETTKVQVMKT
jgi:Ca2+-binding EF-hand superfamily protein